MQMRKGLLAGWLVCSGYVAAAGAADVNAKLAPLVAMHGAETEKITSARAAVIAKAGADYLKELELQGEKATKSENVAMLGAIPKEKDKMKEGFLPVAQLDLPKLLVNLRKAYVKAVEDADSEAAKKRKDLDAKYLAALVKIAPADGSGGPELTAQVEEEKKRVLGCVYGPMTNLQTQLAGTKWQNMADPKHTVVFQTNGRYEHWKYTIDDEQTVTVHWNANSGKTWKLDRDGRTLKSEYSFRLIPGG